MPRKSATFFAASRSGDPGRPIEKLCKRGNELARLAASAVSNAFETMLIEFFEMLLSRDQNGEKIIEKWLKIRRYQGRKINVRGDELKQQESGDG